MDKTHDFTDYLKEAYDHVNPDHYKDYPVEVIDMMDAVFGTQAVINYCYCCAFKYRMRAGKKPDQPIERDYEKEKWYLNKAKELESK